MQIEKFVEFLKEKYGFTLTKREPLKVLIGTILSHRTKDEITFPTTDKLFKKFKTAEDFVNADITEIEEIIKPVGFYRQKAKRIKEIAQKILEEYGGEVPRDIDELLKLPGVGRKTANCVLAFGFGKPALPVDTHVHRIMNRTGIVNTKTPEETEKELKKILKKEYWGWINKVLVRFGKEICLPRNPRCSECGFKNFCKKNF